MVNLSTQPKLSILDPSPFFLPRTLSHLQTFNVPLSDIRRYDVVPGGVQLTVGKDAVSMLECDNPLELLDAIDSFARIELTRIKANEVEGVDD